MKDAFPPGEPTAAKTGAEEKIAAPTLPAADAELLYGTAMIGRWFGLSEGQVKALINDGTIPTFRMPGRAVRCAIKSELNATVREYASRPRACAKAPPRKRKPTAEDPA